MPGLPAAPSAECVVPVMPAFGQAPVTALALAVLAGGLGQVLLQWPQLRQEGFRFRFDVAPRDPGLREILLLLEHFALHEQLAQASYLDPADVLLNLRPPSESHCIQQKHHRPFLRKLLRQLLHLDLSTIRKQILPFHKIWYPIYS